MPIYGRTFIDWNSNQIKRILDNPVYTGRIAFGRTKLEKVKGSETEYKRVRSNEYILSEKVTHQPIISDEILENAQLRRKESTSVGNPTIGRNRKHLLSGILKCPMCGSAMYSERVVWRTKDGVLKEKWKYQCGHYAKSKFGQCKKNAISAEWVETEVIKYTKLLVNNEQFAEDIQRQIGQKVDVSEIDIEIKNYQKTLEKLERSKSNLERDIDNIFDDDKNAERKRNDMNIRLNRIYDEIYDIENIIIDSEERKIAAEKNILTKENVYKMLLIFDEVFDIMNKDDKRKLIESLISEIRLHPKETWEYGKNPIKEIKYTFPVSNEVMNALRENASNVETVCLMSRIDK